MRLFIAEKPSLGRELAKVLNANKKDKGCLKNDNGDVVTWCFGHIMKQFEPQDYNPAWNKWNLNQLPIIPDKWKLNIDSNCKEQFYIIKKLAESASEIVNAGDPDREGQFLVDEVLSYIGNKKPVKRILLNALDTKSITSALNSMCDNKVFEQFRNAALARSHADWLFGMNLTRLYTLLFQSAGYHNLVLRIGRVKTPTMMLVVHRENEIKSFKPVDYFVLNANWKVNNDVIKTTLEPNESFSLDEDNHILDKTELDVIAEDLKNEPFGKVLNIETEKKKEAPRLPYSLSTLSIEAGEKFGYDPQLVLDTMQKLYEAKYTTYPRSDCNYIPENQFSDASTIIKNLMDIPAFSQMNGKINIKQKTKAWNDKKITAHHALIPTSLKCDINSLSNEQRNLYLMVAKAYLAQFLPDYVYEAKKVTIAPDFNEKLFFISKGRTVIDVGWRILYSNASENSEDNALIPDNLEIGKVSQCKDTEILSKQTKPPKRFTTATLLKAMKEIHKSVRDPKIKKELKAVQGIGTEATRASIIDELLQKDKNGNSLLKKSGKYLIPTDTAFMLESILPNEIVYPDMTALWEEKFSSIENSELSLDDFEKEQENKIKDLVAKSINIKIKPPENDMKNKSQKVLGKCPRCGKNVIETSKSFSCEGWRDNPKCNFSIWKDNNFFKTKGITLTAQLVKRLLAGEAISFSKLKKKDGKGTYSGIISLDDKGGQFVDFKLEFDNKKK